MRNYESVRVILSIFPKSTLKKQNLHHKYALTNHICSEQPHNKHCVHSSVQFVWGLFSMWIYESWVISFFLADAPAVWSLDSAQCLPLLLFYLFLKSSILKCWLPDFFYRQTLPAAIQSNVTIFMLVFCSWLTLSFKVFSAWFLLTVYTVNLLIKGLITVLIITISALIKTMTHW